MENTPKHTDEIWGQYASDYADSREGVPFEDTTGTLDVRGSGGNDLHNLNLHDELSTTPDEADGVTAKEASELDENGLTIVNGIDPYVDEQLGDHADEWLRIEEEKLRNGNR